VPLSLAVLLKGIGDRNGPVAEILPVHGLNRSVGGLKAGIVNERKALGVAGIGIALYLGRGENDAKCREGVVEQLLVHLWVQVADEDVGAHIQILLMG
jgi:hypothetical protein